MSVDTQDPWALEGGLPLPEALRDLRVFDTERKAPAIAAIDIPSGSMNDEIVYRIMRLAYEHSVSDLTIQSDDKIWASVKGRQVPITVRELQDHQVRSFLEIIGGSVARGALSSRTDWDGRYELMLERGVTVGFRCNATRARIGLAIEGVSNTLRQLPKAPPHISTLHLPVSLLRALFPPQGMVLICGATGHGKSTLIASIIGTRQRYGYDQKLLAYESPTEFTFEDVPSPNNPKIAQTSIPEDLGNFADAARNLLRRAPGGALVGEIRDLETLNAGVLVAQSGHLLLATLHVETVHEAISRMITLYPQDAQEGAAHKILGALRVIVVQRLLPTLDGGRMAVRSWCQFDLALRNSLAEVSVSHWPRFIRDHVAQAKQDFGHFARQACVEGKISFAVYADEAGLTDRDIAVEREKVAADRREFEEARLACK